MKRFSIRCPSCGRRLKATVELIGSTMACPGCRTRIEVVAPSAPAPSSPRSVSRWEAPLHLAALLIVGGLAFLLLVPMPSTPVKPAAKADLPPVAPAPRPTLTADTLQQQARELSIKAELDELREENAQLSQQLNGTQSQFDRLANWVLTNFRGKFPIASRFIPNLDLPAIGEDFALHGDVAEFLDVTSSEKTMVDDALLATRLSMHELETQIMSVTAASDDHVVIQIPPYAKEGAIMREDLYAALETTLGGQRFDRLVDVGGKDLEKQYHYFGNASRTLEFRVAYPKDQKQPPYLVIRDGWLIPDGESAVRTDLREESVYEIPPPYLTYANWMPQNVAAFARP